MNTKYKNDVNQFRDNDVVDLEAEFKKILDSLHRKKVDPESWVKTFDPVGKTNQEIFDAVRAYPPYDNIYLMDSTVNGEETSVIGIAFKHSKNAKGEPVYGMRPVFVMPTPNMVLISPDGQKAVSEKEHLTRMALGEDYPDLDLDTLVSTGKAFEA